MPYYFVCCSGLLREVRLPTAAMHSKAMLIFYTYVSYFLSYEKTKRLTDIFAHFAQFDFVMIFLPTFKS